jgi:hypothetical protein
MRDFFVILFILLTMLAACNAYDGDGYDHVEDYEHCQEREEALEQSISQYLEQNMKIREATVQLNDGIAVVGLNLSGEHNDDQIIALKKEISGDIKAKCGSIRHVAITTSPDLYEKILPSNRDEAKSEWIDHGGNEVFEIAVPTP